MTDNQDKIDKRNKDQIREIIESESGMAISEAIKVLYPKSKQTFYNNAKVRPLKGKFISLVKSKLKIDLSRFGITEKDVLVNLSEIEKELQEAKNIIYRLNKEIEELKKKGD